MPVIETRDGLFDVSSLKYEAIINCLNCMQQINGRPASGLTRQNICMSPSNEVDTLIFMTLLSIVADVLQVRSVSSESVRLARRVQTIACRSEPESGDSQIDQLQYLHDAADHLTYQLLSVAVQSYHNVFSRQVDRERIRRTYSKYKLELETTGVISEMT